VVRWHGVAKAGLSELGACARARARACARAVPERDLSVTLGVNRFSGAQRR